MSHNEAESGVHSAMLENLYAPLMPTEHRCSLFKKNTYLESLNFSASCVRGFILSPAIPLNTKVEAGGSLDFFFCLVWKRDVSIEGFLIPADKDATAASLTGGSFFPTCC